MVLSCQFLIGMVLKLEDEYNFNRIKECQLLIGMVLKQLTS